LLKRHQITQLAAARAQIALATAALRSCQADFLKLQHLFNEVHSSNQSLANYEPLISPLFCSLLLISHLSTLIPSLPPQVMLENNELRATALLH
jgi:hypothetical protein